MGLSLQNRVPNSALSLRNYLSKKVEVFHLLFTKKKGISYATVAPKIPLIRSRQFVAALSSGNPPNLLNPGVKEK